MPGAVAGAVVAVRISDASFQRILGIVMVGVVLSMMIPRRGIAETTPEGIRSWWIYPALFGIGFYGGFIQMGVGFLFMAAFYHLLKINLVFVNMHKVVVVVLYTGPTLLVFVLTDHVDWTLGLSLGAGNALGAWWAAKRAVRCGEKLIRYVLMVVVLMMTAKILGVF